MCRLLESLSLALDACEVRVDDAGVSRVTQRSSPQRDQVHKLRDKLRGAENKPRG
jgi:hypothetical protein